MFYIDKNIQLYLSCNDLFIKTILFGVLHLIQNKIITDIFGEITSTYDHHIFQELAWCLRAVVLP